MKKSANLSRVMETENHLKNRWGMAKRTFLLIAVLCINVAYSFAQDIITLKNGDDVKALVQEIGDTDVKYKKFENPSGPNYTLKKSEILMIRYVNGSKDVFANTIMPTTDTKMQDTDEVLQKDVEKTILKTTEVNADDLPLSAYVGTPLQLTKKGLYTFAGTNRTIVGNDAYVNFLKENCPEAYNTYKIGRNAYKQAKGTMYVGLAAALSSIVIYATQGFAGNNDTANLLCIVGGSSFAGGCIFMAVSSNYLVNSMSTYNMISLQRHKSDISLNFGVTRGGVGFTLNFN